MSLLHLLLTTPLETLGSWQPFPLFWDHITLRLFRSSPLQRPWLAPSMGKTFSLPRNKRLIDTWTVRMWVSPNSPWGIAGSVSDHLAKSSHLLTFQKYVRFSSMDFSNSRVMCQALSKTSLTYLSKGRGKPPPHQWLGLGKCPEPSVNLSRLRKCLGDAFFGESTPSLVNIKLSR